MNKGAMIISIVSLSLIAGAGAADLRGAAREMAVVISNVADMYSSASADTDVVSQALLGMNVLVLEKKEGALPGGTWYMIETPDTYHGWIEGRHIRLLGPGAAPYASSGSVFAVTALLANVYLEPDVTEHKPVTVAPIGCVLEIARKTDERWFEVVLPGGGRGFIQTGDGILRTAPFSWPRIPPEATAELARRFLGLPYLWGGGSPFGLDCSGFVQLLYRMSGVPILRDAGIQMTDSGLIPVARGTERTADLVFFGKAPDKISHVGMMINDRQFIHATTYERPIVQISVLGDEHWLKLFQGARRPAMDRP